MSRKMIPAEELFAEWRKDPAYVREFEAMADEFALAGAIADTRGKAKLMPLDAAKVKTSQ